MRSSIDDLHDRPSTRTIAVKTIDAASGSEEGYFWTRTGTGSYLYTFHGESVIAAVASAVPIGVTASTNPSGETVLVLLSLVTTTSAFNADHCLIVQVAE